MPKRCPKQRNTKSNYWLLLIIKGHFCIKLSVPAMWVFQTAI